MAIEVPLISNIPLIPIWFYGYSAVAYGVAALVSFLISFFAFRLYRTSSMKLSLILFLSFLSLGLAFTSLTATSIYTYFYQSFFRGFFSLNIFNYLGFNYYYLLSLIAYLLFLMFYLPSKNRNYIFITYVTLWYINSTSFHITSIALLAFVVLKNLINYFKKRNTTSLLVLFSFSTMVVFHLLLLLLPFNVSIYLIAHALLVAGFASLLLMLIRVSKR